MSGRRARKLALALLLALSAAILSGCVNAKQINRITFVTVLGFEPGDNGGVRVHALAAVPGKYSSLSPGGSNVSNPAGPDYLLTAEGANASDAIYKLKRQSARDIEFGHTKIVLFSSELAEQGLAEQLDFLMRREELQIILWIGVTKGSPVQVMQARPATPESVGDWLVDFFSEAGSDTMEVLPIQLFQFYSYLFEPGMSPFAMVVDREESQGALAIGEMALFRGDQAVGYLPASDVKYLSMLRRAKKSPVILTVPEDKMSFALLSYKVRTSWRDDRFRIRLKLNLDMDQTANQLLRTGRQLQQAEDKLNEQVKADMEDLIRRLQELRTDPIGFGEQYRLKHGGHLDRDKWLNVLYPQQQFEVTVDATIQRRGMLD